MSVEAARGCGYRKVGGIYLVCDAGGFSCDRLPIPLCQCPTCGAGIKFARGWTWVDPDKIVGGDHVLPTGNLCPEHFCPVCRPSHMGERAGLIWVGEKFYSPEEFATEARDRGVSRRVKAVPRGFKLGQTWVMLAHIGGARLTPEKAEELGFPVPEKNPGDQESLFIEVPALFMFFRATRIEHIITESQSGDKDFMEGLEKKGWTPVVVPDDDPDHNPGNGGQA